MSSKQKKAVKSFCSVTGAGAEIGRDMMQRFNNDVNRGVDFYFNNRSQFPAAAAVKKLKVGNVSKLSTLFDSYAGQDEDSDAMFDENLVRFFSDIKVDAEGMTSMALAWKINADGPGEFSRKEFTEGFSKLGCSTLVDIKSLVGRLEPQLRENKSNFSTFYKWCFKFCLEDEKKQLEVPDTWGLKPQFLAFISKKTDLRCISRDLWDLTNEFAGSVRADLSNYNPVRSVSVYVRGCSIYYVYLSFILFLHMCDMQDEGAWPVVLDEFCEFVQESRK
jgi:hypothetical protein